MFDHSEELLQIDTRQCCRCAGAWWNWVARLPSAFQMGKDNSCPEGAGDVVRVVINDSAVMKLDGFSVDGVEK